MNILPCVKSSNGQMEPLQVGKWYVASYGFDTVEGLCTTVLSDGAMLSFRWGDIFRQRYYVPAIRILGETNDPRIFSSVRKLFD